MYSEEKKSSEEKTSCEEKNSSTKERRGSSGRRGSGSSSSGRRGSGSSSGSSGSSSSGPKANSTSTMFLTSTISVPNNDEIILSVSTVLQCQMLNDTKSVRAYVEKIGDSFDYFNDDYYISRDKKSSIKRAPSVETVYQFMSSVFEIAQFSPECNVISLVYINRLMAFSGIMLHSKNWRPLLLSAVLLAQKVWDDKCLANVDFPIIWRAAVPLADASLLDLKAINTFERMFLELLSYNVTVSASLYAKYYFELRSLCEANLRKFGLEPLSAEQAKKLEASDWSSGKKLGDPTLKSTHSAMTSGDMKPASRSRAVLS